MLDKDVKVIHIGAMQVPSLQTLRALDAAARLGSYTRAADALGLTHGAVSHRIRSLEARLGTALFVRQGNGMVATAEAQRLLVPVREALDLLAQAFAEPRNVPNVLRVSMLPSFASRWLTPRLGAFRATHPQIDLRIDARLELAEIGPGGVDCAIRYGRGNWPGLRVERIADERLFPVCSPAYRDRLGLESADDLARATLLRHDRQLWKPWFRAARIDLPEPVGTPLFSDTGLLLDAAIAGEGIALARAKLVEGDLASGRLVRLPGGEVDDHQAYHLVRRWEDDNAATARFAEWIAGAIAD